MTFKRKHMALLGTVAVVGLAYAATQITVNTPFALSDGISGDKPKLQRAGDGTLIVAYGDSPAGAGMVYDVKAANERTARDIFVKTCKPSTTKTCDLKADWSPAVNVSNSATLNSTGKFDWRGTLGTPTSYPGDIDKPNIKTSGPMIVLTWISKYCPGGDQRAVRYLERESRVIPFSCTWTSYSINKGQSWSSPLQLSTGERDAIQDSSRGSIGTDDTKSNYNKGQVAITWQEDPEGLQLGEADGPGDGASGANVTGGTDIWYAHVAVDLTVPSTPADDFVVDTPVRLTDNQDGFGISGSANNVFDGTGANVAPGAIEKGQAGASRANVGMVGSTTIVAYEETKGSNGLAEGKFIRYHAFGAATPPATPQEKAGCIISDPLKNARRVRFLTQGPDDAGPGGIQIALFWKEGIYDKGGPSDIVLRRGIDGLQPADMTPAVGASCATSLYADAINLVPGTGHAFAENISSNTPVATTANLTDNTEANYAENALAHRGVLRGTDLWVGYSYTSDLSRLAAQLDNYNFWIRKFTMAGGWQNPMNVTNIADKNINVREPRIFGTPKSSSSACPTGDPADPTTTDGTFCQNADVVFLAWGTQTNVSPYNPLGAEDLGIYVTVSNDAAATFATPVQLSAVQGGVFGDDEAASESQPLTRPDGTRFYATWAQKNLTNGTTVAEYASGDVAAGSTPPPAPAPAPADSGGGCTAATGQVPFDPVLPLLATLGLAGWGLRRVRRS